MSLLILEAPAAVFHASKLMKNHSKIYGLFFTIIIPNSNNWANMKWVYGKIIKTIEINF